MPRRLLRAAYQWWAARYCPRAIARRIGRRGIILILGGLLCLLAAAQVAVSGDSIDPADAIAYEYIPIPVRVSLWLTVGVAAIASAVGPKNRQGIGYAALCFMPAERIGGMAWSVTQWLDPGYPSGTIAALGSIAAWAIVLGLVFTIAGWDEDAHPAAVAEVE